MLRAIGVATAVLLMCGAAQAQSNARERGEYLAKHVAMCVQCHSPRDHDGKLIEHELFLGAPIPLASLPGDWATRAPRIARLPSNWSEEGLIRFLETGMRPNGTVPKAPMPPFRMNREDAAAIAAFLKSLGTSMTE